MNPDRNEIDPGAAVADTEVIIARSEDLRRAGKYEDAMIVLREALELSPESLLAKSAEALIWLERGEPDLARDVLQGVLSDLIPPKEDESVAEPLELDAENSVPSLLEEAELEETDADDFPTFSADSPYANPTMASLLENQGLAEQASALRDEIAANPREPEDASRAQDKSRLSVVAQLERWLNHLQRGARI